MLLPRSNFEYRYPALSRDGKWLAYATNESGTFEVYVQPYPGPGPRQPVSVGGGTDAVCSPDGGELFYRAGRRMMAAEIDHSTALRVGPSRLLFEGDFGMNAPVSSYDVTEAGAACDS